MCDELTQLYNRYKMRDIFTAALEGFSTGRFKFSITIADIDDFKKFNDTYGHEAGDFILRETAQILLQHAHQYSWSEVDSNTIDCPDLIVSRWGGEEFLIVQTYKDSIDESIQILKNIKEKIAEHSFLYKGENLHITITAGCAEYKSFEKIHETIDHADERLYTGKKNGKNQILF